MEITLYYAEAANCCERVRWALSYKQIPCTLIDVDAAFASVDANVQGAVLAGGNVPGHAPDSCVASAAQLARFRQISPFGRVPVMELDGMPLSESMAMVELLEEVWPTPTLIGDDARVRAQVREVCEVVNASIHPVQNSSVVRYFLPDASKAAMRPLRAHWVGSNLAKLQSRLFMHSPFAVGTAFSLADIFVVTMYHKGLALGATRLPALDDHVQHLLTDPAIVASCPFDLASALT